MSYLNRNILRISGLNSGLDTASIVRSMLTNTQNKINKQFRSQTKLEWMQEKYTDINNELRKLKDEFGTVLKQEQNMLSAMNYKKFNARLHNEGDAAYLSVLAGAQAKESTVTVDYIGQLAKASHSESSYRMTGANGQGLQMTDTLEQVHQKLLNGGNSAGFTFTQENGKRYVDMTLEGKELRFSADTTLSNMLSTINASSSTIKISYTQASDTFLVESRTPGLDGTLNYQNNNVFTAFDTTRANIQHGREAVFSVNGQRLTRSSNEFEIDGVSYSLKKTFNENHEADGKSVSFTTTRDIEHSMDVIKKYIDAYNGLVDKLYGTLTEKRSNSYYPLTDEEKENMTEKQIEKWELEAKKGLMRNDNQLQNVLQQMRSSFYMKIPGGVRIMADIGVGGLGSTMLQNEEAKMGKMFINEDKLRAALTENPDEVFNMFTARSESGNLEEMGLVTRLNTIIDNYVKNNENVTQYNNGQAIDKAKTRYNSMLTAMYKEEDRLWKRFTQLEKVMGEMSSQSQWIGNQMLGL